MLRRARSRTKGFAWPRRPVTDRTDPRDSAPPSGTGTGELWPVDAHTARRWRRGPGVRTGARLAVQDALLVGLGAPGVRIELPTARTLWIFRGDGRDGLAVLDRHSAALLVIEATFDPYLVRAFADRYGLGVWLGTLSATEPRYRLAGTPRLRGPRRRNVLRALRRWAATHGFTTATART